MPMPEGRRARTRTRWIAIPLALAALVVWLASRLVVDGAPEDSNALHVAPEHEFAPLEDVAAQPEPADVSNSIAREELAAGAPDPDATRGLEVRVVDDGGRPLTGGRVTVAHGEVRVQAHGRGVLGLFDFDSVPQGEFEVIAEDFRGVYDARATHRPEPGPGRQRVELVLRRHVRVPVVVQTPEGERLRELAPTGFPGLPVRPVVVASVDAFAARLLGRAPTDGRSWGAGSYAPSADPDHDGVLECLVPPPLHVALVLGDVVLETRLMHGAEPELVFVVSVEHAEGLLAGLVARVVDGATGRVPDAGGPGPLRGFSLTDLQQTGRTFQFPMPDGELRLENLTPGRVRLTLEVPGYALDRRVVELEPGRVRDLGTLALWPASCIVGRVVDSSGNPLPTVPWIARPVGADQGLELGLGVANDDAGGPGGVFVVCSLPQAELLVGIEHPPWAVNGVSLHPRAQLVEGVELVARPGTRVVLAAPAGAADGVWFCVRDASGRAVWAGRAREGATRALHLLPGVYRASAGAGEAAEWGGTLDVGDAPLRLDLTPLR